MVSKLTAQAARRKAINASSSRSWARRNKRRRSLMRASYKFRKAGGDPALARFVDHCIGSCRGFCFRPDRFCTNCSSEFSLSRIPEFPALVSGYVRRRAGAFHSYAVGVREPEMQVQGYDAEDQIMQQLASVGRDEFIEQGFDDSELRSAWGTCTTRVCTPTVRRRGIPPLRKRLTYRTVALCPRAKAPDCKEAA